jgi:hypothetical protein
MDVDMGDSGFNFVLQSTWVATDASLGTDSPDYWIEVGVVREKGFNQYVGEGGDYGGWYWGRNSPSVGYDEWRLAGDIGTKGTYHTYVVRWNGSAWDVRIDGVTRATASHNGFRAWKVQTGIENLHCRPSGGALSWSDGTEQQDWGWLESSGAAHYPRPNDTSNTQVPGHVITFTDAANNYYACAHLNRDDWCDDP